MNKIEHIVSVPFDKIQRLRYMFLEKGMQYDGSGFQTLYELKKICSKNKHKLEKIHEIVEEILSKNEKVLIFATSRETASLLKDTLREKFEDEICLIAGNANSSVEYNSFISKDKKICILTEARMIGLHFDQVENLIHYELPNNLSIIEQREGRIRRLGSMDKKKNIYYLYSEEKFDHHMYKQLMKQKERINSLLNE